MLREYSARPSGPPSTLSRKPTIFFSPKVDQKVAEVVFFFQFFFLIKGTIMSKKGTTKMSIFLNISLKRPFPAKGHWECSNVTNIFKDGNGQNNFKESI